MTPGKYLPFVINLGEYDASIGGSGNIAHPCGVEALRAARLANPS